MHARSLASLTLAATLIAAGPWVKDTIAPTPDELAPTVGLDLQRSRANDETATGRPSPDRVSDLVGGIAARLHVDGRTPVPGELYMLMAKPGSDKLARVYDETVYTPSTDRERPDMGHSNAVASELASEVVGHPLEERELTQAPRGGPSAGVAYALAYLNIDSVGAHTGDLSVAATGELLASGDLVSIRGIDEKLTAALLAGADVLFTPSVPDPDLVEEHSARIVGDDDRSRPENSPNGRGWDQHRVWGATAPEGALDIVIVRHLGEVAAYLCGTGSQASCDAAVELAGPTGPWTAQPATRTA